MPLHIKATPGQVAPVALLVGDPGRARRIAALLDGAACYNENRGLLGFSGNWRGAWISVQATGIGGPSAAIVVEELADLGVKSVIRLGTCGAVGADIGVLDLAIAIGAIPLDGATRQYVRGDPFAPVPDFDVTRALVDIARQLERRSHTGLFISEDAFYRQPDDWDTWQKRGVIAVEMEAATIFTVALQRRLRAGAACLVVDRVADRSSWASEEAIADAMSDLISLGLAAAQVLAEG